MSKSPTATCAVCGKTFRIADLVPASLVRGTVATMIADEHPAFLPDGFICHPDLDRYRARYVQQVLEQERGELSELEADVVRRLADHELVAANVNREFDRGTTMGGRVADRVASFGGSWVFVIGFLVVLVAWIVFNSLALLHRPFDPYPFILLNLVLSCLAAMQAPVIMMSQNRQEAKDRLRAEHDYRVNLKAELEIRLLSERIDRLLNHQWQRLLEIQQIQVDLIEQLDAPRRGRRGPATGE